MEFTHRGSHWRETSSLFAYAIPGEHTIAEQRQITSLKTALHESERYYHYHSQLIEIKCHANNIVALAKLPYIQYRVLPLDKDYPAQEFMRNYYYD